MRRCWLILSLFVLPTFLSATPILLKNADELIGNQDETTNTRTLIGNVELQQNNVVVNCNRAIQYLNTNIFLLQGNVVIKQDSLVLKSETILYDGNTNIATTETKLSIYDGNRIMFGGSGSYNTNSYVATFWNGVILEDDTLMAFSDSIIYWRKTSNSKAIGRVLIIHKNSDDVATLTADSVLYDMHNKTIIANGNPTISTSNKYAIADTIRMNDEDYYFTGNFLSLSDDINAVAVTAHIIGKDELVMLYGNPQLFIKDADLYCSDSISVQLLDNKPQVIYAYANCMMQMRADSINDKIDTLLGDNIDIYIENDTLKTINSKGNASSIYYNTTKNEPDGKLESNASQITIQFKDGKPEEITLIDNVQGKYIPEPLIKDD